MGTERNIPAEERVQPCDLVMQGDPEAIRMKAKRCRAAGVDAIIDMSDSLRCAATQVEELRKHVNAMCGWAELIAEQVDWTRDNAATFWAARDAARKAANG